MFSFGTTNNQGITSFAPGNYQNNISTVSGTQSGGVLVPAIAASNPDFPDLAAVSIEINGNEYFAAQAIGVNQPGTFEYLEDTGELLVFPYDNENLADGSEVIVRTTEEKSIITNTVNDPYPSFLKHYNYTGTITINRTWRGHPTATLQIITDTNELPQIKNEFRNGKELNMFGIGFIVERLTDKRYGARTSAVRRVDVTINLIGKWGSQNRNSRSKVDELISLDNTNYTTLSQIASIAGFPYSGDDLTIYYEPDQRIVINPRQEIERHALSLKGYIYYSNPNQVEIRPWISQPVDIISDYDIVDTTISTPRSGYGYIYGDVQLLEEFRNAKYSFDIVSDSNFGVVTLFEYENCVNDVDLRQPDFDLTSNF